MSGIRLGLRRITLLLDQPRQSWKAIHVAGTNGKGSVCNYTYQILLSVGIKCGMFTSPHLIDRWDGISINGITISKERFHTIESRLQARNEELGIKATSFELLTATAFKAFSEAKIEVAVIEVGVGGREDATNVINTPSAAVITKLGLDHEDLLGKGMENIVDHKAGIMRWHSPCLVDGTNSPEVLRLLEERAKAREVRPLRICHPSRYKDNSAFSKVRDWMSLSEHKQMHLILAMESVKAVLKILHKTRRDWKNIIPRVIDTTFPGRQQFISIRKLTDGASDVLLDGCHNEQSAFALKETVDAKLRGTDSNGQSASICWILAASSSKDIRSIFHHLVQKDDNVVATEFGPVDGMPWISPTKAGDIIAVCQEQQQRSCMIASSVLDALRQATALAKGGPIVIAGSLYLVSDVLRLLRDYRKPVG